jgi:hypothetical protein
VQARPLVLSPHELFTQVLGGTQSLSRLQVSRQVPPAQTKVPQDTPTAGVQLPRPSHVNGGVRDEVLAQAAGLHRVSLATYAQAPARQAPVVPQVSDAVALHCPCGSGVPSRTAVHSPSVALRLQALHASVQAELQQVPWAQNPESHSPAPLHSAPSGFLPQKPATQNRPATQSASRVQLEKQADPLQT